MNERIRLLGQQAEVYADVHAESRDYVVLRDEHFAQLIVQDCISMLHSDSHRSHTPGWLAAMEYAEGMIKEHFGIDT